MVVFKFNEDVQVTIKVSKSLVEENGKLKRPLKGKELLSSMKKELLKEGIKDITDLGVYPLTIKLWIVSK